jgi:hypothetical protein
MLIHSWPDRFEEVERRAVSVWRIGVSPAESRIEPGGKQCKSAFELGQRI